MELEDRSPVVKIMCDIQLFGIFHKNRLAQEKKDLTRLEKCDRMCSKKSEEIMTFDLKKELAFSEYRFLAHGFGPKETQMNYGMWDRGDCSKCKTAFSVIFKHGIPICTACGMNLEKIKRAYTEQTYPDRLMRKEND